MPEKQPSKRRLRLDGEIGAFVKQYARRKQKNMDPNDRGYDRELEQKIKKMKPEELDELLNGPVEENQDE